MNYLESMAVNKIINDLKAELNTDKNEEEIYQWFSNPPQGERYTRTPANMFTHFVYSSQDENIKTIKLSSYFWILSFIVNIDYFMGNISGKSTKYTVDTKYKPLEFFTKPGHTLGFITYIEEVECDFLLSKGPKRIQKNAIKLINWTLNSAFPEIYKYKYSANKEEYQECSMEDIEKLLNPYLEIFSGLEEKLKEKESEDVIKATTINNIELSFYDGIIHEGKTSMIGSVDDVGEMDIFWRQRNIVGLCDSDHDYYPSVGFLKRVYIFAYIFTTLCQRDTALTTSKEKARFHYNRGPISNTSFLLLDGLTSHTEEYMTMEKHINLAIILGCGMSSFTVNDGTIDKTSRRTVNVEIQYLDCRSSLYGIKKQILDSSFIGTLLHRKDLPVLKWSSDRNREQIYFRNIHQYIEVDNMFTNILSYTLHIRRSFLEWNKDFSKYFCLHVDANGKRKYKLDEDLALEQFMLSSKLAIPNKQFYLQKSKRDHDDSDDEQDSKRKKNCEHDIGCTTCAVHEDIGF
jgi:hypothetical protein